MCEAIIQAVERQAAGRRVAKVRVRVGRLLRVHEPALEQCFELVAQGTVAEGASIEMVELPVVTRCKGCGHEDESDELALVCPICTGSSLEVIGGEELLLESICLEERA
jgi:hydrogenase nickel incorporation protein HypA/HybF